MANSKLLTRIVDQNSQVRHVPTIAAHEWQQTSNIGFPIAPTVASSLSYPIPSTRSLTPLTTTISPALRALLVQKVECVGHRVQHCYALRTKICLLDIRAGPNIVRRWSDDGKSVHKAVPWKKGMCISSTLRTQLLFSKRMTLALSYLLDGPKLNFNCSLIFHGLLQAASPAYAACQKGDWLQLRSLLQEKRVSITDSTGYGDTLLHVRYIHPESTATMLIVH